MVHREPHDPAPEFSLRVCLGIFISTFKQVCSLSLHASAMILCKPSRSPNVRLRQAGFTIFVPCISGAVHFNDHISKQMLIALVSISMSLSKVKLNQLDNGLLHVRLGRLSLRGIPAWRKLIKINQVIPIDQVLMQPPAQCVLPALRPDSLLLYCRHCKHARPVQSIALFEKGKWRQLLCAQCYQRSSARLWHCVCGAPWTGCRNHARAGFACCPRPRPFRVRVARGGCGSLKRAHPDTHPPPTVASAAKMARTFAHTRAPSGHRDHVQVPDNGVPTTAVSASQGSHNRETKRPAPHTSSRRPKPKPKARCTGNDALAAITRLRVARDNPL